MNSFFWVIFIPLEFMFTLYRIGQYSGVLNKKINIFNIILVFKIFFPFLLPDPQTIRLFTNYQALLPAIYFVKIIKV